MSLTKAISETFDDLMLGMHEAPPSSVSKALTLLETLAKSDAAIVGICDLASEADLPKSTAHRLLKELEERGFVDRSGIKYRVGRKIFELSSAARWSEISELRELAIPTLEWLFDTTGATVHLAVLDGTDVFYAEKITGAGGCRIPSRVGGRTPATCTALGKAILAFSPPPVVARCLRPPMPRLTAYSIAVPKLFVEHLAEVRRSEVAYDREEARLSVACVGAPVLQSGKAVAGVSVGGVLGKFDPEPHARIITEGARRLARAFSLR